MARWDFYYQTLAPWSNHYAAGYRVQEFPINQFTYAASAPQAPIGYGIGTASQAVPHVARVLGAPRPQTRFVESGYGTIIVELGFPGLLLWFVWTIALVYSSGRTVMRLRGSSLFSIGLVIFWFAFILLFAFTYSGIMAYQNFVYNAYLWILIGVLFKLPEINTCTQLQNN
jgi:hypothetical protein